MSRDVEIRQMRPAEFRTVREPSVEAFGGDGSIGDLLDTLRISWAWEDELSYVAEVDGDLVGHVLYTRALVDSPEKLLDILLLSPVAVRLDMQNRGIGSNLIRASLAKMEDRAEPLVFLEGPPPVLPAIWFRAHRQARLHCPLGQDPPEAFTTHPLPAYETWMNDAVIYSDASGEPTPSGFAENCRSRSAEAV